MPPKHSTVRVFVDTNLVGDSGTQTKSVMLLENSGTTIRQLKVRVLSRREGPLGSNNELPLVGRAPLSE